MKIFKSINKLNKEVNFKANIGFVPTMGALHKGHISLIESSKKKCKKTIVSIFVNPSQFNKSNDFNKYPKNYLRDIKILKKIKIDYLLIPTTKQIYKSQKQMRIKINNRDKVLCAKHRKGHFEGVLGVINQLLKIVRAKYIFLGEKDYQQIYLIKKFIKKKYKTKVVPCKTIRDKNFLPYSSRNFLLKKNDLLKASKVSKKIKIFYHSIKKNLKNINNIKKIKSEISKIGAKVEYIEIRNRNNFPNNINKFNFKIFIAYYLNKIRLIDNF